MIEKITSTLEFDRKKHFKFLKFFENHRILDFKQLNLIEKITSNFEKFEKFEVLMRTLSATTVGLDIVQYGCWCKMM